eukprot:TRINITY_DN2823_c0_g1_i3.p1 TRINITY_DN2823_c0_g1~~TRINITY_DN2823_c0_g1_i3.p1  ORF type:complete len:489 (+),score=100.08 TRINITY_DN2823_c0_g1_i3:428-1894(+)
MRKFFIILLGFFICDVICSVHEGYYSFFQFNVTEKEQNSYFASNDYPIGMLVGYIYKDSFGRIDKIPHSHLGTSTKTGLGIFFSYFDHHIETFPSNSNSFIKVLNRFQDKKTIGIDDLSELFNDDSIQFGRHFDNLQSMRFVGKDHTFYLPIYLDYIFHGCLKSSSEIWLIEGVNTFRTNYLKRKIVFSTLRNAFETAIPVDFTIGMNPSNFTITLQQNVFLLDYSGVIDVLDLLIDIKENTCSYGKIMDLMAFARKQMKSPIQVQTVISMYRQSKMKNPFCNVQSTFTAGRTANITRRIIWNKPRISNFGFEGKAVMADAISTFPAFTSDILSNDPLQVDNYYFKNVGNYLFGRVFYDSQPLLSDGLIKLKPRVSTISSLSSYPFHFGGSFHSLMSNFEIETNNVTQQLALNASFYSNNHILFEKEIDLGLFDTARNFTFLSMFTLDDPYLDLFTTTQLLQFIAVSIIFCSIIIFIFGAVRMFFKKK